LSTSPAWKQEVNQRLAAHRGRKACTLVEPVTASHHADSRVSAAAARVAARFANAPSYSEILAGDARAAVRAAEAASRAALEAQAAAESVLAGLEAAAAAAEPEPAWELRPVAVEEFQSERPLANREPAAAPINAFSAGRIAPKQAPAAEEFAIRWEPDMPARQPEPAALHETHGEEATLEPLAENWQWSEQPGACEEAIETVEPAQPIHANLIEFPREIVATRKVRPRLAEGPFAASEAQLSIFEVDPGAISTDPAAPAGVADVVSEPAWTGPEWSGIELDAQPSREYLESAPVASPIEPEPQSAVIADTVADAEPDAALHMAQTLDVAPLNRRLMAALVNGSLIAGAFLAAAVVAASNVRDLPALRGIEIGSAVALLAIGALYNALFYALGTGTPGMSYAGVSLCTFDGQEPTRAQRLRRLIAMPVSILPLGLGLLWAIFDGEHLNWHDRLSKTYLRRYY
jgi:uncharacterized RDD family membrane protein YckC